MSEARRLVLMVIDDPEAVRRLDIGEEAGIPSVAIALVSAVARLERGEVVIERRKHRRGTDVAAGRS